MSKRLINCPSCGQSGLWKVEVKVQAGVETYWYAPRHNDFELIDSTAIHYEKTYTCRGCLLTLNYDHHHELIERLDIILN